MDNLDFDGEVLRAVELFIELHKKVHNVLDDGFYDKVAFIGNKPFIKIVKKVDDFNIVFCFIDGDGLLYSSTSYRGCAKVIPDTNIKEITIKQLKDWEFRAK